MLNLGTVHAAAFTFPDGSVQTSAAMGTGTRNPMQISLLRWYEDNESGTTPWPSFNVGSGPRGLAFDGANIWGANSNSDTVTKLRATDGDVQGTFNVGNDPRNMAFDGANIWVTNYDDNTVTKLRATDGNLQGTFNVGDDPIGVAFDGANIWVANSEDDTVTKL